MLCELFLEFGAKITAKSTYYKRTLIDQALHSPPTEDGELAA